MKKIATILVFVSIICMLNGCDLFHQHTFSDASCTNPRTCTECGETEGEALGHNFNDATCTQAQICTRCAETTGSALGHSTNFGKCNRCATKVNVSVWNDIYEAFTEAKFYADLAVDLTATGNVSFVTLDSMENYFSTSLSYYKKMQSLCSGYSELSGLKNDLNALLKITPELERRTQQGAVDFLEECKAFIEAEKTVGLEVIKINNNFK